MSEIENKSKKTRTGYLTSPSNINAANHLSYLFQVSKEKDITIDEKIVFIN
jgi:hypothetical protein